MKKVLLLMLSALLITLVMFAGCENTPESETADNSKEAKIQDNQIEQKEFYFYGYGEGTKVPDFLTEEQQDLYKTAVSFNHVRLSPDRLDDLEYLPLKAEQEYIEPIEGSFPHYTADDGTMYAKSIGRYRKWEDFEKFVMTVFTPELFDEMNEHKQFIEINGDLYFIGATGMPYFGYSPDEKADIFNLISSGENEIRFTVTGYFNNSAPGDEFKEWETTSNEIILTKTANGWRFSKFSVVW